MRPSYFSAASFIDEIALTSERLFRINWHLGLVFLMNFFESNGERGQIILIVYAENKIRNKKCTFWFRGGAKVPILGGNLILLKFRLISRIFRL